MMADMSYRDYNSIQDEFGSMGSIGSLGSYQMPGLSGNQSSTQSAPLPRVLLMGTRRSGKSSIIKVVFNKMSPHETLFLESTSEIRVRDIVTSQLMSFTLFDFPGNFDFQQYNQKFHQSINQPSKSNELTPEQLFSRTSILIYVIDAQDDQNDFSECVDYFTSLMKKATSINPNISVEVLIHKFDGDVFSSADTKNETFSEIKQTLLDELNEARCPVQPSFYATSIYDHSIFEAFSKICQKLIFSLNLLENLLDSVVYNCDLEKIFLFDVVSKIYLASDSNPVDASSYELCSDLIDVVVDVLHIYGTASNQTNKLLTSQSSSQLLADTDTEGSSTTSVIELSNDYVLYYRSVSKYLSLVSLMRQTSWTHRGLIDYNFNCLSEAITQIINVKQRAHEVEEERDREKKHFERFQQNLQQSHSSIHHQSINQTSNQQPHGNLHARLQRAHTNI